MLKRLPVVAFGLLLLLSASAFGQKTAATPDVKPSPEAATKTDEAATIKAEAEKSSRAFVSGDYSKVLDSTYPKILEMGGGKSEMLAAMEKEMRETLSSGVKIVSLAVGEPEKTVRAGTKLLAVVPMAMKIESSNSFVTQRSFWLAVSTDDGKSWTFIDGSALDKESLKIFLPEAVDKITLPSATEPVLERKPAG